MQENRTDSELRLLVTGTGRDGRRHYDRQSKQALVKACLKPGVSLAGMALKHGVNANLLRKWMASYRLTSEAAAPAAPMEDRAEAFIPVILASRIIAPIEKQRPTPMRAAIPADAPGSTPHLRLRAQLLNGVTLEIDCAGRDAALLSSVIETLGRCDVPSRR